MKYRDIKMGKKEIMRQTLFHPDKRRKEIIFFFLNKCMNKWKDLGKIPHIHGSNLLLREIKIFER